MKSKKAKPIETESSMVVTRCWRWEKGEMMAKRYTVSVTRKSFEDLMYRMMIAVNNIILYM